MLKKSILTLVLAIGFCAAYADVTLPGKCLVGKPTIIKKDLISEEDVRQLLSSGDWGQSQRTDEFWQVWSDRDNNVTYTEPSKNSNRYSTLRFNEPLRIAKIEKGFALVYIEKVKSSTDLRINQGETKGWVPMQNLLLWASCPTNEKGIYNKAIPLVNSEEYQRAKSAGREPDLGRIYKNPVEKSGGKPFRTGMDFYFVMKTDKVSGQVLLSKECKIDGQTDQVLFGWVSKESFFNWNLRACIEPTWDKEAAEKLKGEKAYVYRESTMNNPICEMLLGETITLKNGKTSYRMNPYNMRYPLIENVENLSLYKVTGFGTSDGKSVGFNPDDPSLLEAREKLLKEVGTINLIVVIDGTSSMKNFYKPTQEIIKRANDFFGQQVGNNVRVGVVIYRDYEDGQNVTEYMPMTSPTSPQLASFLTTGGKYGVRSVARPETEAMYKGLEVALDCNKMGYTPKQSNLMFIIGDCGNHMDDQKCLTPEEIIKRCIANGVQLSAFQVYNGTSPAYKFFRSQTGNIIRESLKKQFNVDANKGLKVGWVEKPDGYEFTTNMERPSIYMGNTRNAPHGQTMEVSKLYDLVRDSYIQFNSAVEARKSAIINGEDMIVGVDEKHPDASALVYSDFIVNMYDPKDVELMKKRKTLMSFEGYSYKKDNSTNNDYWKEVIYISKEEFDELMRRLQPVKAAAEKGSEDRAPYINAMKALVRIMMPELTEAEINGKGVNEIMALAAGLPAKADALKGHTIQQIGDNKVVNAEEFDGLVATFIEKYGKLDRIKTNKYDFSMTRNGQNWYWIPIEDLP